MRHRVTVAVGLGLAVAAAGSPAALACTDCAGAATGTREGASGAVAAGRLGLAGGYTAPSGPARAPAGPATAPVAPAGAASGGGPPIECVVYDGAEAASGYGDEGTPLDTSTIAAGTPVFQVCTDLSTNEYASISEFAWPGAAAPAGAGPAPVVVPPEVVAELARAQLQLPSPVVRSSPPPADQVVKVVTWLAVDDVGAQERTASVGPVSATVSARPLVVAWDMGDGGHVSCDGSAGSAPGSSAGPACSYEFTRSSGGQPGAAFHGSVSVSWSLTWSSNVGAGGDLGTVVTTSPVVWEVDEIQSLVTREGRS